MSKVIERGFLCLENARCSVGQAARQLGGAARTAPARARLDADRRHLAPGFDPALDYARQRKLGGDDHGRRVDRRPALAGPLHLRPGDYPAPRRRRPADVLTSMPAELTVTTSGPVIAGRC